jgi:hypothetical protein
LSGTSGMILVDARAPTESGQKLLFRVTLTSVACLDKRRVGSYL